MRSVFSALDRKTVFLNLFLIVFMGRLFVFPEYKQFCRNRVFIKQNRVRLETKEKSAVSSLVNIKKLLNQISGSRGVYGVNIKQRETMTIADIDCDYVGVVMEKLYEIIIQNRVSLRMLSIIFMEKRVRISIEFETI
ncbi:MAG: hypothetical protein GY730_10650 [bacterium]|nr:hypothetical protein [bacterium]